MAIRYKYFEREDGVKLITHYSDQHMYIRQDETGAIYDEATDIRPCPYHYSETDIPIEDDEPEISD